MQFSYLFSFSSETTKPSQWTLTAHHIYHRRGLLTLSNEFAFHNKMPKTAEGLEDIAVLQMFPALPCVIRMQTDHAMIHAS